MLWELPPQFKIYEALGAVADERIEVLESESGLFEEEIITAKQYSSSRNKFYTISYNPHTQQIMSNDNATWFVGYLGYPAISLLLHLAVLKYNKSILEYFTDIKFKDINQKYKNDFTQSETEIRRILEDRGLDLAVYDEESDKIYQQLKDLKLSQLGEKVRPPKGY
jgi:outer membrane lipoprotein-sorting protein